MRVWILFCFYCLSVSIYGQNDTGCGNDIMSGGLLYEWCIWKRYEDGRFKMHHITKNQDKVFNDLTYHSANINLYQKCYWRYEDDKLYRYNEAEGSEYVLFDFGLDVNEVFEMWDGRKMRLTEVVDTTYRSLSEEGCEYGPYKLLKVVNEDDDTDRDEWLEGFGSMLTSVFTKEELGADICESHVLWTAEFPMINMFNTDHLKTQLMLEGQVTSGMDIESDTLQCEFKSDTLVVSGGIYIGCAIEQYMLCVIQNDYIHFEVDGVVKATCTGMHWFTVRFPGFNEGKYTLKYLGWNGKVIEKEVVCGTAENIHPLRNVSNETKVFDLSGRKIGNPPSQGLYIQNGKVVMQNRKENKPKN